MIAASIVMPCHNRREALALTLAEMCKQTVPAEQFEVIVVDQASTDGCRELVRSLQIPYRLRLLEQDAKYGPAVARNAGVAAANGDVVILLDADLVPDQGLVAAHAALQADGASLGCGRILPYAPAYTSFIDRAARPEHALDRGDHEGTLAFWDAFSGNLSLTREVFRRVGPFDSELRSYEDVEFAYRASRSGIPILSCPAAVAYHNHPRTLQERCEQARGYDRMVPLLLARYPELRGKLPFARSFEAIDVRRDGVALLYRKLRARFLAAGPVRAGIYAALTVLERREALPRLAKPLFWRLMYAYHCVGFREGTRGLLAQSRGEG